MADKVQIREVGMRDGLQSIADILPTETKLAWLDAEYAAGVREIEVSSFVPPKLLPQLADAEAVVRHALTLPGLTVSALIPNSRGAERGLSLGVHEMNFVLSVSEGHNLSNVRRGTDESIEDFRRVVALCREQGGEKRPRINCGLATAFGCTIEGDVDEDRVRRIAVEVAEAGADGIILADTVGYGQPAAIGRVFRRVIADVAPLPVSAHFHDTRGLGLANVLAAFAAGCTAFDASLGGLGGCPYAPGATGNVATEDVVYMLEGMGIRTGVDMLKLVAATNVVSKLIGRAPVSRVASALNAKARAARS
jgi:hydroxymethylglutaryl-CoA lyase